MTPSRPQAHRKLGQHVGSCPNADPDHVLEPGKQRGTDGETVGSRTPPPGAPLCLQPGWGPKGHAECQVSPPAPCPAPGSSQPLGGELTHPKCCTTLGNMAASWSMDGYWYLQHGEAWGGGCGAGKHRPPAHPPAPGFDMALRGPQAGDGPDSDIPVGREATSHQDVPRAGTYPCGNCEAPACCPGASTWHTTKCLVISCMSS